ncbi:uncharacterized protein LOC112011025 isoform X3 [Quercus suber]|uniref:uncharacterized protein LOC112011025 isoform X3 n=1 Tax=Quercus suber TaxID=58331 RepID=UPI0032DF4824
MMALPFLPFTYGPSTTAVILKFELMYAPILNIRPELQASLEPCSVAVHEFRIPPNALLGMHSYCPVHFDASHAVLLDISVHVSSLRTGSYIPPLKVPSIDYQLHITVQLGLLKMIVIKILMGQTRFFASSFPK